MDWRNKRHNISPDIRANPCLRQTNINKIPILLTRETQKYYAQIIQSFFHLPDFIKLAFTTCLTSNASKSHERHEVA